ncbi:MAG: hypothetical protein AB7O65_06755 [Candidatus Korobacteraceae bacterium]
MNQLLWDVDVWAEAMVHLLQCEREDCRLCLAISEQCIKESASMEAMLEQRGNPDPIPTASPAIAMERLQ